MSLLFFGGKYYGLGREEKPWDLGSTRNMKEKM
jgi:hypothetical protein